MNCNDVINNFNNGGTIDKNDPTQQVKKVSIKFRRDFSDFPFKIVPFTEEEKKNHDTRTYIKFKTSYYEAWVHILYEKSITPEHLENKSDTEGMRMARQYTWGRMNGKEAYQVAFKYPYELQCITDEYNELSNKEIRDNYKAYGKLGEQLLEIQNKYNLNNFLKKQLFQYQFWKRFAIIGMIFVSAVLTIIYYSKKRIYIPFLITPQ